MPPTTNQLQTVIENNENPTTLAKSSNDTINKSPLTKPAATVKTSMQTTPINNSYDLMQYEVKLDAQIIEEEEGEIELEEDKENEKEKEIKLLNNINNLNRNIEKYVNTIPIRDEKLLLAMNNSSNNESNNEREKVIENCKINNATNSDSNESNNSNDGTGQTNSSSNDLENEDDDDEDDDDDDESSRTTKSNTTGTFDSTNSELEASSNEIKS